MRYEAPYNIRIVSTYPPRRCGIGTFSRDLANALEHFTGEVANIRVAAIDNNNERYDIPVDLVIRQHEPKSWRDAIDAVMARANESAYPTVVLLQHEYGLDPNEQGEDGQGTNFVTMARRFAEKGLLTFAYLHTVLEEPDGRQKMVLQELARWCAGLIVTTESAVNILESKSYQIDRTKIKHIDHGIRMQHPSQYDRLAIKDELGLAGKFLVTTLGLLSPDKGIEYGIRGYGKFLRESCTESQREQLLYAICGQHHPDFVRAEGGIEYRKHKEILAEALRESGLTFCRVSKLPEQDLSGKDVVFLDTFLDERTLLMLYAATNVMILPYLNMQQVSSGILADTVGTGRAVIATKFRYAMELIHSNKRCYDGIVIGRHARGILVDSGEASVDQIAQGLDYLVFSKARRLRMEKQAHQRGYQMRWSNSAWALIQYIEFTAEEKEILTGRGVTFKREKPSIYEKGRRIGTGLLSNVPNPPLV